MSYRIAESLDQFRSQCNAAWPERSKASDGWIGDAAHQADPTSDHNPWVKDGAMGVVTAFDLTHDPKHGVVIQDVADALVASRDPRIKYLICNRRIISSVVSPWVWRPYTGTDPHTGHLHMSVMPVKSLYDSRALWHIQKKARYEWQLTADNKVQLRRKLLTRLLIRRRLIKKLTRQYGDVGIRRKRVD